MAYLIAQMWIVLAVAAGLGLLVGLASGALTGRQTLRTYRQRLEEAETSASKHREDAARSAARLQTHLVEAADLKTNVPHQDVVRLEAQLRDARSVADREAAAAADLRARIAQLESATADEGLAALEAERDRLAQRLAAAEVAPVGDTQTNDALAAERDRYRDEAAEVSDLRTRVAELEARERDLTDAAERLAVLEAEQDSATQAKPVTPDPSVQEELDALRAELAQLKSAPADGPDPELIQDLERLRWRNQYLSSRVTYLEGKGVDPEAADDVVEMERLRARVSELEAAAAEDQSAELARLRERVVSLEAQAGSAASPAQAETVLTWRNRYLSSRVQYLERRMVELETHRDTAADNTEDDIQTVKGLQAQLAGLQAQSEEAARLRARVHELEASGLGAHGSGAKTAENDHTLEWRNRYLNSRVKYLEDQVAALRQDTDATPR